MIEESVFLQDRVPSFATTEFCQGKTMRWGLAWTFDKSVTFPKSEFTLGKKEVKKSVVHVIPTAMGERREPIYDTVSFLKQVFSELQAPDLALELTWLDGEDIQLMHQLMQYLKNRLTARKNAA
nr:hypothetical protein BaRGS_007654 [Batillaria attramentaria]